MSKIKITIECEDASLRDQVQDYIKISFENEAADMEWEDSNGNLVNYNEVTSENHTLEVTFDPPEEEEEEES